MAKNLRELSEARGGNVITELWGFMRQNKKWWLTPIVLMLLLLGVLILVGGTGAAPFIYTIF
jgi:Family of unknown function (DUF5989)